jgi:hypothetical protein
MGLLMLRGISSTRPFGHAKQCVINAFDTNYLMSVDEVMATILNLAQNMDEEVTAPGLPASDFSARLISAFVAMVAVRTSDADTTPVALVVAVVFPTYATHVVV